VSVSASLSLSVSLSVSLSLSVVSMYIYSSTSEHAVCVPLCRSELDLSSNRLDGPLPDSLSLLTDLT
jgi:hypothetical protein